MAWSERQRRAQRVYVQETRQYATEHGITYNQARDAPEYKYWRQVLRQFERRVARGQDVDKSPHGDYERALSELGYRRGPEWWNVGETPKIRRRIREALR